MKLRHAEKYGNFNKYVLSLLCQPSMWHYLHFLLSTDTPAATDRYLLPTGCSAANPPASVAAVDQWDRQTKRERQTGRRPTITQTLLHILYYASSAQNATWFSVTISISNKHLMKSIKNMTVPMIHFNYMRLQYKNTYTDQLYVQH